jgi:hypothetical protein
VFAVLSVATQTLSPLERAGAIPAIVAVVLFVAGSQGGSGGAPTNRSSLSNVAVAPNSGMS